MTEKRRAETAYDDEGMNYLQSIPRKVVVVYIPLAIMEFVRAHA